MIQRRAAREARAALYEVMGAILPTVDLAGLDECQHLADLGADSIDRVEIIGGVLHRLRLAEPLSTFDRVPDVASLLELLTDLQEKP